MSNDICDARATLRLRMYERSMTVDGAAKALQISPRLLEEIMDGGYTHPKIALRIQKMFGLTEYEVKQLVSPNRNDAQNGESDSWHGMHRHCLPKADEANNEYWNYKSHKYKGKVAKGVFGV